MAPLEELEPPPEPLDDDDGAGEAGFWDPDEGDPPPQPARIRATTASAAAIGNRLDLAVAGLMSNLRCIRCGVAQVCHGRL